MTFEPLNRNRTIWNCLRLRSGNISGNNIFKFAVPAGLRARRNCFSREESLRTIAFAKPRLIRCVTAADLTTRYDPFCENVFGASRRPRQTPIQYKNNISFKYAQSEAEGILNGQITWNKKNLR